MAATITSIASGTSTTSGLTCTTGATVTAVAGDWLVVLVAGSNDLTTGLPTMTNPTDSVGNSYTQRVRDAYSPGAVAGDGAALGIYTCHVTTAITNGTITANFFTATNQKAVQVYRFRPGTGETASHIDSDSPNRGTVTSHSLSAVSVTSGDTIFAVAAIETDDTVSGDSDTTNGAWSAIVTRLADGGADADSMSCSSQYKTVSGTGSQNWACTTTASRDSQRGYVILRTQVNNTEIDADPGSYAITGTAATPRRGQMVAAAAGSYAVTGTDATLNKGKTVAAAAGSYAVTGTAASLEHGWKVAAGVGEYVLTGSAATPSWSGESKTLTAAAGSYLLTGSDVGLDTTNRLSAGAGSYAITGTDASLNYGKTIAAAAGSYVVTGVNASLEHGWVVAGAAGSYAVTGSAVTLTHSIDKRIAALAGSYALTGAVALLQHEHDPEVHLSMPLKTYAPRVYSWVELTPAVQAAAYGANQVVFVATEVPNFTWRTNEPMTLQTAYILDEADQAAAAWTLYFGRTTFTLGTINEDVTISDADARLLCGVVQIANTETQDLINSRMAFKHNIGLVVCPGAGTKSCFVAATQGGTPTYAATTDIKLRLGFVS